jgi:putative integrin, alpha subunit
MHNFYLMAFCLMLSSLTISAQNEVRKEKFQLVHDEVVNSPSTVPDSRKYPPESDPYAGVTKNGVYAVGTPGTSFNVSDMGAAVYNIKIDVPDAGPLTPQISLTYNSQSTGYGLAGYGVNISGISVITRGSKNLFHDGEQRGVVFNASDNLFLDGKRLIYQSGNVADSCAIYTVEGDPFTKVFQYGFYPLQHDRECFKVVTTNGLEYEYTTNDDATLFCGTIKDWKNHYVAWYVSVVRDRYGNTIRYSYDESDLNIRPVSIVYGSEAEVQNGKCYAIHFAYEKLGENSRPFVIYGKRGKHDVRLTSIATSLNGELYRKYTLSYNEKSDGSQAKWTRLVKIDEENGKGEKYSPVVLHWRFLSNDETKTERLNVSTHDDRSYVEEGEKSFLAADLTGDGISDIIRISPVKVIDWQGNGTTHWRHNTYVYVSRSKLSSSGYASYETPLVFSLPASISMDDIKSAMGGSSVMDFDGDGYNDLIIPQQNKVDGRWNEVDCYVIFGSDVVAGNEGNAKVFPIRLHETDRVPLLAPFDTDGNGKDDVVCVEQHHHDGYYPCTIVKYEGGKKLDVKEYKLWLAREPEKIFVGDYNNDGLSDLIVLYSSGYKIYFNAGGKPADERFVEEKTAEGTNLCDRWRIQQGDFDGDGLIDFVYNCGAGDTSLWVAYNNGDGTFRIAHGANIDTFDHATEKDDNRFSLMAWDMDCDGLTDVMVCKAGYRHHGGFSPKDKFTQTAVRWLRSTGNGLVLKQASSKDRENDALENSIFLGDFDGDGQMELANYGSKLNVDDISFNGEINVYKVNGNLASAGKVEAVFDGFDISHSIQYAYATSPNVYKRTIPSNYPVNTYTLPISVVKHVRSGNGHIGMQEADYSYEDLRIHIAGRGLLGFNKVIKANTTLNVKSSTEITKWDEKWWMPIETKSLVVTNGESSSAVSTSTIAKVGNNYFAYTSKQEMVDMDGNHTITRSTYDVEKGVPTEEIVENDGDAMYRKVRYDGYTKKGGRWLPTIMTKTQKHRDDASLYTNTTTYTYDGKGNTLSTTENSGTELALTITATYNEHGNVLTTISTGKDINPITKHYEYDPTGRLVVKNYTTPETSVNTFTYDQWGNLLTQSDVTNPAEPLITKHTYDNWGREIETVAADGTRTKYERGWCSDFSQEHYERVSTDGSPTITTWYDNAGREVQSETVGPNGTTILKETTYNNRGQVTEVENTTGKFFSKQELAYDGRGRLVKEVLSSGKTTTYTYGNRTVTSTIAETDQSVTKTFDAWGNVVKVEDPSGIVTYKYASVGKPASVTAHGSTVCMTYDTAGNQTSLADPDAGTSTYAYAADGTLLTQRDGKGINTIYEFDDLGRIVTIRQGRHATDYLYGSYVNGKPCVDMLCMDGNCTEYKYDRLGHVISEKRYVKDKTVLTFEYTYNDRNQLAKMRYPSGLEVTYSYDDNGYKMQTEANGRIIYRLDTYDGLMTGFSFMGKLTIANTRNKHGYEVNRKLTRGNDVLENFTTEYDGVTGNLLSRLRGTGLKENFSYDRLDRLTSCKTGTTSVMKIDYAPNGNILFKTGIGNYSYDEKVKPHAIKEVDNTNGDISEATLTTAYNDFGKVELIADNKNNLRMSVCYGPDQERWTTYLSKDGNFVRSTVYAGDYEQVTERGIIREFHYLDGNVIFVRENSSIWKPYLAFTDNLGSILSVFDEEGQKVFDASYDAWGKQTITQNDIGLYRGYTGHEMLNEYGIINMNGRLYDPVIGRFFSPDNYVQMPDNSQNFNRYSYCLNNPLKYTDPSGELFGIDDAVIAFAVFNLASSMMQASFNGQSVWKAGAISLLSSVATYGIGEAFKGMATTVGSELLRAGAHGLSSGVTTALEGGNFISGFASGALASGIGSYAGSVKMNTELMIASTTTMGGVAAWATGGDFLQGAMQGMNIGVLNHAMHDDPPSTNATQMLPEVVVTAKRIPVGTLITKIIYIGTLVNKYRSQGIYTMYYGNRQVFSCNAVSGASNCQSYTIPDGDWTVVSISDRSESRFTKDGVGYTANLNPDPFFDSRAGRNRQYIRIHPARSNGTNGCIGLRADKVQLVRARNLIRNSLKEGLTIKLHVHINEK